MGFKDKTGYDFLDSLDLKTTVSSASGNNSSTLSLSSLIDSFFRSKKGTESDDKDEKNEH
jgi:hypothetical protein